MQYTLNGQNRTYDGDPAQLLITHLRGPEDIMTVKDGCSGQGSCGGCTVLVDGRPTIACTTPMKRVEGRRITTIEGLDERTRRIFARTFVEHGGVQCGFCSPGIVLSAKALLDKEPCPTAEQIEKALSMNLCRCSGYPKIVESIQAVAARLLQPGDAPLERDCKKCQTCDCEGHSGKIGTRLPKYDAEASVLGTRPFVADLKVPGMLYGALRFSDHPRARVVSIDTALAQQMEGVVRVFTAEDVPGQRVFGLIVDDWPLMVAVGEETRYVGDVICGVVAKSEETARAACLAVHIEYDVLPPLCDPQSALQPGAPLLHPGGNILAVTEIQDGDVDAALAASAFTTSGTYTTQRVEHAFLEPECCLATCWDKDGQAGLQVFSQSQGVYEDRKQIGAILGLPLDRVNVVHVQNGGAFGGKEDMTVQGHAALFAWLLQTPVRVALSRPESMIMHPKRHPFDMHYTVGCDKDGKLTAVRARLTCDTGAYASVGMKVIERAVAHGTGAYTVPALDIRGMAVYTNNIPCGAMRGFGVPQATFAMESCIDELCEKGGFDRWQFRWDNAIVAGSRLCTGQIVKQGAGVRACLEELKERFQAATCAGLAAAIKNTGIGCGMADIGKARIVIESADRVVIHHGWTEMGQGVHTMAIQSLVEETGIDPRLVEVRVETQNDTPCGMTTSSRGTSLVGHAIIDACKNLKRDLATSTLSDLVGREYRGEWTCNWTTKVGASPQPAETCTHYSYSYAAQMVELDDRGRMTRITAAHDAGRIMNPTLFEGQIEGSIHMGLGYALTEEYPMKDGRPLHTQLVKCKVIRPAFVPPIDVLGVEVHDPDGPFGAKGIGEIGLCPTAAAVANALYQFDGKRRRSLPMRESQLMLGWK